MDKRFLIVGFVSLILGLFFFVYSNSYYFYGGFNPFFIISITAIISGLIFVVAGVTENYEEKKNIDKNSDKSNNPIEVLNMRYAKGEITKKEFEEKKKDLEG